MFERIEEKLKMVSIIIFWLSVVIGGMWILFTLKNYAEQTNAYFMHRLSLSVFLYPIIIIFFGIVTSYLIYGFGELIGHVRNIDCSLNSTKTVVKEDKLELYDSDDEK